jgi:hypothetical protein
MWATGAARLRNLLDLGGLLALGAGGLVSFFLEFGHVFILILVEEC